MLGAKTPRMSSSPRRSVVRPIQVSRKPRPLAQSPGTLVHRGEKRTDRAVLRLVTYDIEEQEERELSSIDDAPFDPGDGKVRWLHVTGLHEVEEIARIGWRFGIDALSLEDILHTSSRSKIENRETGIFVVMQMLTQPGGEGGNQRAIEGQHFALLLLPGDLVLTFCETPTAIFDPVLHRIRTNIGGRIRRHGADYLTWAVLDAVVDNYLLVIDRLDDEVVAMDEKLQTAPNEVEVGEIYALKRDINRIDRAIRPVREIAGVLLRENATLLGDAAKPFFLDLNDHAIQAVETTEFLREGSAALRELYLSLASHRMNEVMKVLTCFSTIFLPLTFIAGVYGMNFEKMPELEKPWAYPAVWAVFILCAAGMFWVFRRMKWL